MSNSLAEPTAAETEERVESSETAIDWIPPGQRTAFPRQVAIGADPRATKPLHQRLDELFDHLCQQHGSAIAVISADKAWTFTEIDARANQVARLLIEHGVKPGDRVGLLLNRSPDTYVAMLAVAKARASYVPLAPAFPDQRLKFICDDAELRLVISVGHYQEKAERLPVPTLLVDELSATIDLLSSAPLDLADTPHLSTNVCYILYTSGTTGQPKGVVIEHRSLCNFIRVAAQSYGYQPGDRVLSGHDDCV